MKKHKHFGNLENDCIAILAWAYRNQGKYQSYRIFEEELGIPLGTLHRIIKGFEYFGEGHWALETYAKKYGYTVTYVGKEGSLIWVDKRRPHLENEELRNEDGYLFQI
jgi:hypothetical protein|tara:strand:+ start:168 stop:491 length:324 start_codon:yes stop_codon:yes gene_type:complete